MQCFPIVLSQIDTIQNNAQLSHNFNLRFRNLFGNFYSVQIFFQKNQVCFFQLAILRGNMFNQQICRSMKKRINSGWTFRLIINIKQIRMSEHQTQTIRSIIRTESMNRKQRSTLYSFACECGKAYDSYPALYLHFKRTHKIKITTKISGVCSQTMKKDGQRTFTYFYSNNKNQFVQVGENSTQAKNKVQIVFEQFWKECENCEQKWGKLEKSYWDFFGYINCNELTITEQKQKILHQIPNYFNQYLQEKHEQLKQTKIYNQFCRILFKFGSWLRFKGHTTYIVIAEQQF